MPSLPLRPWLVRIASWPLDLLWLIWVVLTCTVESLLVLAMVGAAGALLWLPAEFLDAKIGFPILEFGIVAMTTVAAFGFLRGLVKTAVAKWKDCPW